MSGVASYFRTTIGKKVLVGVSGLLLAGFVLSHMAGNMLLLVSADAYNLYSYKLTSNPLIYVAEAGLVFLALLHIGLTVNLTMANKAARPTSYDSTAVGDKRTSWIARTLILSGLLILTFLVLHLITFKFGTHYSTEVDGVEMRDLHRLVNEKFQEPLYVGWYLFSLLILWAHLKHGVSSIFQTLGLFSARHCAIKKIGIGFATVVCLGFASQPIYMFFFT